MSELTTGAAVGAEVARATAGDELSESAGLLGASVDGGGAAEPEEELFVGVFEPSTDAATVGIVDGVASVTVDVGVELVAAEIVAGIVVVRVGELACVVFAPTGVEVAGRGVCVTGRAVFVAVGGIGVFVAVAVELAGPETITAANAGVT